MSPYLLVFYTQDCTSEADHDQCKKRAEFQGQIMITLNSKLQLSRENDKFFEICDDSQFKASADNIATEDYSQL